MEEVRIAKWKKVRIAKWKGILVMAILTLSLAKRRNLHVYALKSHRHKSSRQLALQYHTSRLL